MTGKLIIGNCISLIAAIFTAKSSWAKDRWHIYIYQVAQCLLVAVASIFFNSYAGIVTLLVSAFRNYLAATDRLNKRWLLGCVAVMLVLGIAMNNRGGIGWIVIAANVIYSLGIYWAKGELALKGNIILNLLLWIIYEGFILDIPSIIADSIGLGVAVLSLFKDRIGMKQTGRE